MKLLTYRDPSTDELVTGIVEGELVYETQSSLSSLLQDRSRRLPKKGRARSLSSVQACTPLSNPGKFLACAGNYRDHRKESGMDAVDKAHTIPRLFLKPSSTIIGSDEPLRLPAFSHQIDWEGELGVVMGAGPRVFGYTIINDISARSMDWGVERHLTEWDRFFDWLNGKWGDGFAPIGPWIVTADEIQDPQQLALDLKVNGRVRQHASTKDMIFSVQELVAFASSFMSLEPGDIIATGTPAGVGHASATYLSPGDLVECQIEGIGVLRTPIVS